MGLLSSPLLSSPLSLSLSLSLLLLLFLLSLLFSPPLLNVVAVTPRTLLYSMESSPLGRLFSVRTIRYQLRVHILNALSIPVSLLILFVQPDVAAHRRFSSLWKFYRRLNRLRQKTHRSSGVSSFPTKKRLSSSSSS